MTEPIIRKTDVRKRSDAERAADAAEATSTPKQRAVLERYLKRRDSRPDAPRLIVKSKPNQPLAISHPPADGAGLALAAKSLLFEKSNGTFELVIWNNVTNWNKASGTPIAVNPTTVAVNFGGPHGTVNVYDPTSGTAAVATASNANAMNISLADYPIVVEVIN